MFLAQTSLDFFSFEEELRGRGGQLAREMLPLHSGIIQCVPLALQ
jgi:hypothetical protein